MEESEQAESHIDQWKHLAGQQSLRMHTPRRLKDYTDEQSPSPQSMASVSQKLYIE